MTSASLKIGALAELTGTTAPTIRYYEQIGLLPRPLRQEGSQRIYGSSDAERLTFIRRCREFGFPIEQVRLLTTLVQDQDRSCTEVRDLAQEHLIAVRKKLSELQELERSIAGFVERCDQRCVGGPGPECVILEELAVIAPGTFCCSPSAAKKNTHGHN